MREHSDEAILRQFQRRWILYIEDNEDDLLFVRELLAKSLYPVTWAKNAAEARTRLKDAVFSLILLDDGLPDSNALSLLDELKRTYPDIPVIILTGHEDKALAVSALEKGASDFLLKREMASNLRAVIRKTLEQVPHSPQIQRFAENADDLYRVLLSTMQEGCLVINRLHGITFTNLAAERMIRTAGIGDPLGRDVFDLFDSKTVEQMKAEMNKPVFVLEGAFRGHEGSMLISAHTLGDSTLIMVTDISEQKRTRADLEEANRRLEVLNDLKSEFVSIVSHDLRNPISTIKSIADNLLDGILGELTLDQRRALEGIHRKTVHLARFIENLLDLTRIDTGSLTLNRGPVYISKLLREISAEYESPGISIILVTNGHDSELSGDELLLREVFVNLLTNALRFAKSRITVILRSSEETITVFVEDDGPGVDENDLPHIFERYYQGRTKRGGIGLGLSIVASMVEAHGGRVMAGNRSEGGARFIVELPRVVHRADERSIPNAELAIPGHHRILIAEDDVECRETIAVRLRQLGCQVIEVPDGYRAVEMAISDRIDVAVIDVEMPGLDGFEVLNRMYLLENPPAVIFISARHDLRDRIRGLSNGAFSYLKKPFEASELVAAITSAVKQKTRVDTALSAANADVMTGLENLRGFERTLYMELTRSKRYQRPFALVYLDADGLKKINDSLGHPAGDDYIRSLGRAIQSQCRAVDRPARIGGDEFAIICPETRPEEEDALVERIRESMAEMPGDHPLSASVGVAFFPRDGHTAEELRAAADHALYTAKRKTKRAQLLELKIES